MLLIDGKPAQTPALDRGLLYGDGLFETIRLVDGRVPLWSHHWQRLSRGMEVLSMPFSPMLAGFLVSQLNQLKHCQMARITVTRAQQGRGYAPGRAAIKTIVQGFDRAPSSAPVAVQIIEHRLSHQPALVACKHINRLDQVIATASLAPEFNDGIMLDQDGYVTCATAGNLFILHQGVLCTPTLDRAGIQGVMRQLVLNAAQRLGLATSVQRISLETLYNADRIWTSNAVRGLTPVMRCNSQAFSVEPVLPELFSLIEDVRYGRQVI
ncbi:aminodeoxychorismate lyase [Salinibius halmophilus]|uniref:aminodeoxychorismate lyase n=1 Tax=Salinibius halmophilus TaxID=1853216 RepID=UPI000E665385|nr:aminodeoxychorismate lyase [Salinibius halmophilus]